MKTPPKLLLVACAFSFSCLQALSAWREFFSMDDPAAFFIPAIGPTTLISTIFATVFYTTLFFFFLLIRYHIKSIWIDRAFAFVISLGMLNAITFNGFILFDREWIITIWLMFSNIIYVISSIILVVICGFLIWRAPTSLIKIFCIILLAVLPFGLMQIGNAIWSTTKAFSYNDEVLIQKKTTSMSKHNRVMWIIFDELDRTAVFDNPPKGFEFPAFKSFASQSTDFTNVSQAGDQTIIAVPSMTIGKKVLSAKPKKNNRLDLSLSIDTEEKVQWKDSNTVFSDIYDTGANIGIVGWYFPYCRLFNKYLRTCKQVHLGTSEIEEGLPIWESVKHKLAAINPFFRRVNAITAFETLATHSLQAAKNPELDFIFIHLPLPHQPTIFDAEFGKFTPINFRSNGYYHNVTAADLFFSKLRLALEEADLWHNTSIILSSDHDWRAPEIISGTRDRGKIPFFVKTKAQKKGLKNNAQLSATIMKRVLIGLANGEISNSLSFKLWLQKEY